MSSLNQLLSDPCQDEACEAFVGALEAVMVECKCMQNDHLELAEEKMSWACRMDDKLETLKRALQVARRLGLEAKIEQPDLVAMKAAKEIAACWKKEAAREPPCKHEKRKREDTEEAPKGKARELWSAQQMQALLDNVLVIYVKTAAKGEQRGQLSEQLAVLQSDTHESITQDFLKTLGVLEARLLSAKVHLKLARAQLEDANGEVEEVGAELRAFRDRHGI